MAVLEILKEPDARLLQKSASVNTIGLEEKKIFDDMIETMRATGGIGLAAPQVNIFKRMIVIDGEYTENFIDLKMVNPEIIYRSEEIIPMDEGCLSVEGYFCKIDRHIEVDVKYLDENGIERILKATEKLAHIVQHEVDHLDGILFIQRLSKLKYERVLKKLSKKKIFEE